MDVKTPVKAIRAKCLECANWSTKEVTECPIRDCALWPYRKGKRPTPEDVAIVAATKDPFAEQKARLKKVQEFNSPAFDTDVAMEETSSEALGDNFPA